MSEEERKLNWRGLEVKRDRGHENLVEQLVANEETSLFSFNKELMVFAAMLGYSLDKKVPLSKDTIKIVLGTYHATEDDGFIYLLALMENRDARCLKDANLAFSIRVFEEYCNGGLEILQEWFIADSVDSPIEIIEKKMWEFMQQHESESQDIDNTSLAVDF